MLVLGSDTSLKTNMDPKKLMVCRCFRTISRYIQLVEGERSDGKEA